ncbi:lipopolysaccharide assembly protein LapB [Parvibaculum sp.]|uniref:tetratricopeptide repeat protein n=1 Tax=Parvibaculum sp. TaxID=2024848 RepID=UPI00271CFC7B|nr:hypothetical protein [Parvibaculum sp.]MDO9126635.1 hypothetical protein [Parvibaculum sp.]MDP1627743.1 hypothetical protein [Parvibaculum sp.]MDP2150741.1 hypothetical protein [Parvibaculum sp.]MDP3327986.1 hypothetical protein [Parvibaculum sp.]
MRRRRIGLDGFRQGWSIEARTLHGPGRMAAAFLHRIFSSAHVPVWLVLTAALCVPLQAHAVDARSERASLSLTSRGVEAAASGQLAEAQRYLEEAIVANPANGRAIAELGAVHQAGGNAKLARKYYRIALDIDPVSPDALSRLGLLDISEGNRAAAEDILRKLRIVCATCVQTQELARALGVNGTVQAPHPETSSSNP